MFGVSATTVRRWRSNGDGPAHLKVGGRVQYRRDHATHELLLQRYGPARLEMARRFDAMGLHAIAVREKENPEVMQYRDADGRWRWVDDNMPARDSIFVPWTELEWRLSYRAMSADPDGVLRMTWYIGQNGLESLPVVIWGPEAHDVELAHDPPREWSVGVQPRKTRA
jgi:hypothetical protein